MATDLLDLEVKLLVLRHGRSRVVRTLARVGDITETDLEQQLAHATKERPQKAAKGRPTVSELVARAAIPDNKREVIGALAREYETKRFLGERRHVERFCFDHGVSPVPKSRIDCLPRILAVLAELPESELSEMLTSTRGGAPDSAFAQLAGAIIGR